MSRLILILIVLAALAAGAVILARALGRGARAADAALRGEAGAAPGKTLPRLAFALLMALVLYVSIWGAG